MPEAYIIMGERNTRKSATIRALTGAFKRGLYQVATRNGVIDIFVQISALQESGISPQQFIQEVTQNNYKYLLVSLWVSGNQKQPSGEKYIREFLNAGWKIPKIAVLGTDVLQSLPNDFPSPDYIPNSPNLPANQIASKIRKWWQWL